MAVSEKASAALASWRALLGEEAVHVSGVPFDRIARTTQPEGAQPLCVLCPESREAIQGLLAIARAEAISVHPISGGKNWGYGDACAPVDGAAIIDLSRMNKIVEINAEFGYAVIQPGVTQQALWEAIQREAPGYWLDCTGAGPTASITGNILERGFGHTPYGDHVRTTCGLEAVLADGRVVRTGFTHFPRATSGRLYPYGVGLMLDGLFSQSNLGIVTEIGLWLYPVPEAFRFFYVKVDEDQDLGCAIDALRPLRMRGLLNSAVHVGNDLRVISSLRGYPWGEAQGVTPLPEVLRTRLRRESGCGAWNVTGSITGSRGHVRDAVRALRAAVKGWGRLIHLDDRRLRQGAWLGYWLKRLGLGSALAGRIEALEPNYRLLQGIPTSAPLQGTRWRLRNPDLALGEDPREAGCGLLWLSPVVPLKGSGAEEVLALTAPHFRKHGFDLLATFTMLNERSMVAIINVTFDKGRPEEGEAAKACYHASMEALIAKGYLPYRVSLTGMSHLWSEGDVFWEVAGDIKQALDPGGILSPGRYIPQKLP